MSQCNFSSPLLQKDAVFVKPLASSRAVPCQNVLDYFRSVLEFNNQLMQTLPEEQLTEVRPPNSHITAA